MKVIKAIYNFLVGDMIILIGVLLVAIVLGIIRYTSAFSALRPATGPILIVVVLVVLSATLYRETRGRRS